MFHRTTGIILLIYTCLLAQIISAEEVVITASKLPENISDVPASISVISSEEIANSPARNIDDLLKLEGGISILQPTGMGYGLPSQINIRGVPGQTGTLLLVDGMPLNEAGTGFVNINEVQIENIERVEIIRGAFSAVHGADAFGGVINIITHDPSTLPTFSISTSIGNEGYQKIYLQNSYAKDGFGYTISLGKRLIDNYLAQDQQTLSQWDWTSMQYIENVFETENYDYEDEHASLKVTMDLSDSANLTIYGKHFGSELGYGQKDYRPLYPQVADDIMKNRSSLLGATLQAELSQKVTSFAKGYYRDQTREVYGLDFSHMQGAFPIYARTHSENLTQDWRFDLGLRAEVTESQTLSVGTDLLNNHYKFEPVKNNSTGTALPTSTGDSGNINNIGLYIQDKIGFGQNLQLVAGVRLDNNSEFNEAVSPKIGAKYKLSDKTSVRASAGRAYRAPSATELFLPSVLFGTIVFQSNSELEPEYIASFDTGIEKKFGDESNIRCNIDLFYNEMDDLIAKQFSGASLTYQNVDEAWSSGIEAGLDMKICSTINAFVNYTYQQSENETTGTDLEHIAEHLGSLGLRYNKTKGKWQTQFSVMETYVGDRGYLDLSNGNWLELDSYLRTDASINMEYNKTFNISASVQNAFDEEYQEWSLINPAAGTLYALEIGLKYW